MANYPMEKYQFHIARKITGEPYKVIAVSTYGGRKVRGIAKCDPRDEFNIYAGKELAAARCNQKVAEKRAKRAKAELDKALAFSEAASARVERMSEYYHDARLAERDAMMDVETLLRNM